MVDVVVVLAMVPVPDVLHTPVLLNPVMVAVKDAVGKCEQSIRLGRAEMVAC